jgi:hypothetical protein
MPGVDRQRRLPDSGQSRHRGYHHSARRPRWVQQLGYLRHFSFPPGEPRYLRWELRQRHRHRGRLFRDKRGVDKLTALQDRPVKAPTTDCVANLSSTIAAH